MKKIVLFLMLLCFGLCFIPSSNLKATNTYQGINYINPNDYPSVVYDVAGGNGFAQLSVSYGAPFSITPGIEYFILPTYVNKQSLSPFDDYDWDDLPHFQESSLLQMSLYESWSDEEPYDNMVVNKKLYSGGKLVGYAVTFDENIDKVSFLPFTLTSQSMSVATFSNFYTTYIESIDGALLMIEADRISELNFPFTFNYDSVKGSPSYDVSTLYFGENLRYYTYGNSFLNGLSPILSAEEYYVYTSVDQPITIADLRILIDLQAYDEVDGNLTDAIMISSDGGYQNLVIDQSIVRNRPLGTYPIVFSVADTAGNTAECTIQIVVEDKTKPTFEVASSTITYTREVDDPELTLSTILSNIVVTDNYSDVTHEVVSNDFLGNEAILGTYQIVIRYSDAANNQTDVTVTITNVDNTNPVFSYSATTYQLSYRSGKTLASILSELSVSVSDNYDSNIDYMILNDSYSANKNKVGTYTVVLRAIDSSSNEATQSFHIEVIDDVAPVFYFDKDMVIVEGGTQVSAEDIIDFLNAHQRLKSDVSDIEIVQNTHAENVDKVGQYEIKVKITYDNGEIEEQLVFVKVVAPTGVAPAKTSFFASVWAFIVKAFIFVWEMIKWPFEQIINLF